MEGNRLETYNGDCVEVLKGIPDASVDCIITDPPYFDIMGDVKNDDGKGWDNQWDTIDEYIQWFDTVLEQCQRVLKLNGSIYIFADDMNAARVQIATERRFNVLNNIIWHKTNDMRLKGWTGYRSYAGTTERCIFAEQQTSPGVSATGLQAIHSDKECFTSIKEYFRAGKRKAMEDHGWNCAQFDAWINEITETKSVASRHYFADSQYVFPTREIYAKMQATGYWPRPYDNAEGEYMALRGEYEGLRHEYEGLREEYEAQRRKFHPPKNYTDIWTSYITTNEEPGDIVHPCQKPQKILKIPVETSTDPGDVILDPFMGSGSTGICALSRGRRFIGIEQDPEYYALASERLAKVEVRERHKTTLDSF